MIVQNCPLLLVIISKIETMILDQKSQHPELSDEEIIESLKIKLSRENKL